MIINNVRLERPSSTDRLNTVCYQGIKYSGHTNPKCSMLLQILKAMGLSGNLLCFWRTMVCFSVTFVQIGHKMWHAYGLSGVVFDLWIPYLHVLIAECHFPVESGVVRRRYIALGAERGHLKYRNINVVSDAR